MWSDDNSANSMAMNIRSSIKNQTPFGYRIWPFFWQWFIPILRSQIHYIFIWEVHSDRLMIINWLVSEVLFQHTSFHSFLSSIITFASEQSFQLMQVSQIH